MNNYDDPKTILVPEVFFELCKTPEGKNLAIKTAKAARTAHAVQEMLDYLNKIEALGRQLTAEEQQNVCEICWYSNHEAPHDAILQYVISIPDEVGERDKTYDC